MKTLFALSISLLLLSCKQENDSAQIQGDMDKIGLLQKKNDSLQLINLDLQDELMYYRNQPNNGDLEIDEDLIKDSLRQKTDLIPKKGILGGTMRYGWMKVMGNNWIVAQYEDGHIQGVSIMRYKMQPDSTFIFKILDSATDY